MPTQRPTPPTGRTPTSDRGRTTQVKPVHNGRLRLPFVPVGVPRPNRQVLLWGGLAVTAAAGVLEWPVAAAVAVGSYLTGQRMRSDADRRTDSTP